MSHLRKGEAKPIRTGRAARTRVGTFNSPARHAAVLQAVADRVNTGKVTTAQYLATELHAPAEFVASYASPYGRTVAKVYRAEFGHEPARNGLARRGRKLLPVFAYAQDELPVLDKAAREYKRTAELVDAAQPAQPAEAEQQAAQGVTPAALVAELADRYPVPAAHLVERVEAITAGMSANPRLYDPARGTLTEGGASVVRSVIYAEDVEGMLQREAEARTEQPAHVEPGARVSLYVSDRADRVTGTVRLVERDAIGQDVAQVALPGGEVTHQAVRFLVAA